MPGLLMVAKHNFQQQIKTLSLFEVGRIHWKEGDQFKEETCAGILLSGLNEPHAISPKSRAVDFFDLKGIVENILSQLGIERIEFIPSHLKTLHPGQQAKIQLRQTTLGVLGQVHPHLTHVLGCDEPLFFAELNLHDLFPLKKTEHHFSPLPQFPSSERDWTLTVTAATPVGMIDSLIKSIKSPLLESFYLLDLYQNLADRKNVTYRFVYRSYDKTIDYESVQKEHTKITQAVAEKLHDRIILG